MAGRSLLGPGNWRRVDNSPCRAARGWCLGAHGFCGLDGRSAAADVLHSAEGTGVLRSVALHGPTVVGTGAGDRVGALERSRLDGVTRPRAYADTGGGR